MKSFEVKRVDLWDGGDRHNFGFFINADVSDVDIKKAHLNSSIVKQVVTIFETLQEVEDNSPKNLRKSALSKLTPLERQALGIRE